MTERVGIKRKLLYSMIVASLTASVAVSQGWAQAEDDRDESERTEEVAQEEAAGDRIVVTGSRIRRDSFTSTVPLQVISDEEIRDAGLIDTAQILQQSNVAQGVQFDNTISTGGFVTNGGPAANNISLRGLSADRTLVLINGRRYAPAGAEGAPSLPDVNLIPSSMIERIDILLDGASSVYGSDAIAGVVNVILRSNFDGFQADAFMNTSQNGAADTRRYNIMMGSSGDNYNFVAAVEYFSQNRMKLNDRRYNLNAERDIACYQNIWVDADGNTRGRCTGAIINRVRRGVDVYRTPGETDFPGILPVGWSTGVSSDPRWTSSYLEGEDDVIPESERYSFFVTASRDLQPIFGFEGIQAFAEFSHSNSQADQEQGFRGQLFPDIPASNPFNPFGVPVVPIIHWPADRSYEIETQQTRGITGLRGDFASFGAPNWEFEVFSGYTRSIGYSSRGALDEDRLRETIATSRVDANGRIVCGSNISPVIFGFIDPNPCVPVNFFADSLYPIDGVSDVSFATQEELDYLFVNRTVTTRVDQAIAGGFVTGPIFQLPAGDVSAVLGVEWRRDSLDSGVDAIAGQGRAAGFFADRRSVGSVTLTEVYGELSIPILAGQRFAEDLTLDLAGRLTDHEFYGSNGTYSMRLGYSPTNSLTFRGTYGTSFRAPNARELFLGGQTGFVNASADPCLVPLAAREPGATPNDPPVYNPDEDNRDPRVIANCQAEGVDPLSLGIGGAPSVEVARAGNRNLDPETSTAWSLGMVFEQPWFDQFDAALSLNWFKLKVEDAVGLPGAAFGLAQCYNSNDFPNDPFCARRVRDPVSGLLLSVDNTPFNVSRSESSGVDINTRFGMDFAAFNGFRLEVNSQWTWSDEILNQTLSTSPVTNSVGLWGSPEWRGTITSRIVKGDWSVLWRSRMIGRQASIYTDTTPGAAFPYGQRRHQACSALDEGCISINNPDTPFVDFSSYVSSQGTTWYHDLSMTYRQENWILRAGVNNVFNTTPAVISGNSAGAFLGNGNAVLGSGYDLIGRSLFLNVARSF